MKQLTILPDYKTDPAAIELCALKKERDIAIVAHSYVSPDILYGVSDLIGDSYQIAVKTASLKQSVILFSGVKFMAETIKLLNPDKTVYMTRSDIGCTLAESVNAQDVRDLRKKHPGVPIVCYVNTTAEVKAECDASCTSSNAQIVIEAMEGPQVIFLPDKYMAENLKTSKQIIPWDGRCVVHEEFDLPLLNAMRAQHPKAYIMAHPECKHDVAKATDFVGSTGQMLQQAQNIPNKQIILLTECGLSDRMRVEMPDREILGTCRLCPYMKQNYLSDLLEIANDFSKGFEITIPDDIAPRARKNIERMVEIVENHK